jgi:arylsulfatase A-like enzyme
VKKNAPKWRLILAAAILSAANGLLDSAETEPNNRGTGLERKPNLVFILADDLGYGDLGCYGQRQIATPNIDRLARQGVRFTQFYAGSTVCAPSRCVLMTGLHTGHCYIRGNADQSLRSADNTVAQLLQTAGYTNGLFGKWGLGQEGTEGVPTRKGFDEFFGYLDQHHAHNYYPAFLISNESRIALKNIVPGKGPFGSGVATTKVEYSDDLILDRALAFIDHNKKRPFFLYFASTLPHANNEAKPNGMEIPDYGAYRDKSWPPSEKGQAAMISRLDSDVGRLLAKLKDGGLEERTIVFFASDNGPHHEGGHDPNFFDDNGPLRGTKRDLYEGGIRVPLIVRWPGRVPSDSVCDHVGYFGDFFATAAEIAGAACPAGLDSISLSPAIMGRTAQQTEHAYLYWEFYEGGSKQAVRLGNWKGVIHPIEPQSVELYDLRTDLGEKRDVAASNPEVVKQILVIAHSAHVPSPLWHFGKARRAAQARPKKS